MSKTKGKYTNQKKLNVWCIGVNVNYIMWNIQFQLFFV